MKDISHGKAFEKWLHDEFRGLHAKYPIRWERVVDTHDAGNLMGAVDADFKLTINSGLSGRPWVFYLECKASVKFQSLSAPRALRGLVKGPQFSRLRLAQRAGALSIILFQEVATGKIEVWPIHLIPWDEKPRKWGAEPPMIFNTAVELIRPFVRGPGNPLLLPM